MLAVSSCEGEVIFCRLSNWLVLSVTGTDRSANSLATRAGPVPIQMVVLWYVGLWARLRLLCFSFKCFLFTVVLSFTGHVAVVTWCCICITAQKLHFYICVNVLLVCNNPLVSGKLVRANQEVHLDNGPTVRIWLETCSSDTRSLTSLDPLLAPGKSPEPG